MSDELRRRLVEEHGPGVFPEAFTKEGVMKEGWPKGAEAVSKNLDLLVELDEPEQLARELAARAGIQGTTRGRRHDMWAIVVKHALACLRELEEKNQPSPKAATEEAPAT